MVKKLFIFFLIGFESLIALNIEQTIQTTLTNNPNIRIYKENINYFRGLELSQDGTFDTQLRSSVSRGQSDAQNSIYYDDGMIKSDAVSYKVQLEKKFESGFGVQTGFQYSGEDAKVSGISAKANSSKVYFSIDKPLLKGSSSDIVTAEKTLSQLNTQISIDNFKRQISTSVYKSILSYWNYLYAFEQYKINKEAKKRSEKLLSITEKLIKADMLPASNNIHPEVDLNSKIVDLTIAKTNIENLKYDLYLQIGENSKSIPDTLNPDTQFPIPDEAVLSKLDDKKYFYKIAFENRADYEASEKNLEKTDLNLKVSTDDLKSQLDLKLSGDKTNITNSGNKFSSLSDPYNNDLNQHTISLSLIYTLPVENSYAKGRQIAFKSQMTQAQIKHEELKRDIRLEIDKTLNNLKTTILNYKQIKLSTQSYEKLVSNEMKKYLLSMATITDIIQIQDSYDVEKSKMLQILKEYASLLAKLNYNMGLCVEDEDGKYVINNNRFLKIY